jgi:uncharacterized membrane protein
MTENEENKTVGNDFISSKFWRILLVIISVIMIFAGPTYVIYGLAVLLKVDLAASFATGFILFAIGLVLMWYLVRKKVIL